MVKQRDIAHVKGPVAGDDRFHSEAACDEGLSHHAQGQTRNTHYLVTAEGIDLIARRSYRYLRRTVGQWCAEKEGLGFDVVTEAETVSPGGEAFVVASERVAMTPAGAPVAWDLHLAELVVRALIRHEREPTRQLACRDRHSLLARSSASRCEATKRFRQLRLLNTNNCAKQRDMAHAVTTWSPSNGQPELIPSLERYCAGRVAAI
jgi:hypothetical protein